MNKRLILAFGALLFTSLSPLSAKTLVSCSHPELCRVAKIIFAENHASDFEFESLVKIVGDPHEYEPTTTEVKNLIKAEILISGPHDLNPWIKKVNYQRSKIPNLKSINIPLDKKDYGLYAHATHEALSHFWLYPKLFCTVKTRMEEQFVTNKMIVLAATKKSCATEEQKIEAELSKTIGSLKLPIILTHDALLPLLESLGKDAATIVAIKGSGHHQEATPKSVKSLYDALKAPKAVWIEEKGINVPQNILAKKRATDQVVQLDTANSDGLEYFSVLYILNEKLKAIK